MVRNYSIQKKKSLNHINDFENSNFHLLLYPFHVSKVKKLELSSFFSFCCQTTYLQDSTRILFSHLLQNYLSAGLHYNFVIIVEFNHFIGWISGIPMHQSRYDRKTYWSTSNGKWVQQNQKSDT